MRWKISITKQEFLEYCFNTYGTSPDYHFDEEYETVVLDIQLTTNGM